VIASLRGNVQSKSSSAVILEVAGVGYQVLVPGTVAATLQIGDSAILFTTLVVREDSFQLFGFEGVEQQGLFDLLRSVSGVGPKTALSIISTLSPAEISEAVTEENSIPFEKVSGVGVKTAKLIVVTLAGKIKSTGKTGSTVSSDLLSALQSLGWSEKVASPIVEHVCASHPNSGMPELIRACLAMLGK
jgi:holliday junction DNA helicase RuvA